MKDLEAEMEEDEKKGIETAIAELKEVTQGTDKDAIEAKLQSLTELSSKLAERVYAKKGGDANAQADQAAAGDAAGDAGKAAGDESVVDAEFEEVDDSKK